MPIDPGGAAIIAAIILAVGNFIQGRRLKQKTQQNKTLRSSVNKLESGSASIGKLLADQYGFKVANLRYEVRVDINGKTTIISTRSGVRVLGQKLPHLSHRFASSIPGSTVALPELISHTCSKGVTLDSTQISERSWKTIVEIAGGGLTPANGELTYSIRHSAEPLYYMTEEEALVAYKDDEFKFEYQAVNIMVPADTLELELFFPDAYKPQLFPGVFMGESEFFHDEEIARIKKRNFFEQTANGGRIRVDGPILGMRYCLYWMPLKETEYRPLLN